MKLSPSTVLQPLIHLLHHMLPPTQLEGKQELLWAAPNSSGRFPIVIAIVGWPLGKRASLVFILALLLALILPFSLALERARARARGTTVHEDSWASEGSNKLAKRSGVLKYARAGVQVGAINNMSNTSSAMT